MPRVTPTIDVLAGGPEVIDALSGEWSGLCKGRFDEPFYRPEWIAAYVRAFVPTKRLLLVTARVDGALVAVLPLIRELSLAGGIPARSLRAAGNAHTCRFDLVHDVSRSSDVISAIWRALQRIPDWDVLELTDVPHGSAVATLMRAARNDGCTVRVAPRARSPYLVLSKYSCADALDECLDAKFRANLHRRMRKLQTKGAVELVRLHGVGEHLEQFYTLEAAGWKGTERSAIACERATRHFYDAVARNPESAGSPSLYALRCAGTSVAMHYGVTHRGGYYLLKTAYDECFNDCSPGQLITHMVLRDLITRGYEGFDFLGPLMDWKRAWRPRLRTHGDWYAFRGLAGRLLHTLGSRIRPTVGRALRRWNARSEAHR